MSRRQFDGRSDSPLYRDVHRGTGGRTGGKFVLNDGAEVSSFAYESSSTLLQENGFPLLQEDDSVIFT